MVQTGASHERMYANPAGYVVTICGYVSAAKISFYQYNKTPRFVKFPRAKFAVFINLVGVAAGSAINTPKKSLEKTFS